jgi:hypothetical protein
VSKTIKKVAAQLPLGGPMSPFGVKMLLKAFLLSTPLNGKDVPSFAILVFYIIGKENFPII